MIERCAFQRHQQWPTAETGIVDKTVDTTCFFFNRVEDAVEIVIAAGVGAERQQRATRLALRADLKRAKGFRERCVATTKDHDRGAAGGEAVRDRATQMPSASAHPDPQTYQAVVHDHPSSARFCGTEALARGISG